MKLLLLLCFYLIPQGVLAEEKKVEELEKNPEKVEKEIVKAEVPNSSEHESWYIGFSLGLGAINLGSRLDSSVSSFKNTNPGDETDLNIASNFFVYWPVSEKWLLGVMSGGAVKTVLTENDEKFSAGVSILTVSTMYALTGYPSGSGWNLRLGLGYGLSFASTKMFSYDNSESGGAGRIGIGYRVEAVPGTRMIFELTHGAVFNDDNSNYTVATGGVLF